MKESTKHKLTVVGVVWGWWVAIVWVGIGVGLLLGLIGCGGGGGCIRCG